MVRELILLISHRTHSAVGAERAVKSSLGSIGALKGSREEDTTGTCSILGKETKILVPEEMGQKGICASRAPGVGAKLVKPKLQEVLLKALAMTQPNGWPDDADGGAKTRTGIITGISCFQNLVLTRTSGLDQILQLWGRNP